MRLVLHLLTLIRALAADRARLATENPLLRQQLYHAARARADAGRRGAGSREPLGYAVTNATAPKR